MQSASGACYAPTTVEQRCALGAGADGCRSTFLKNFLKKQQQTVPKIDLYGRWCDCAVERSEELSVFVSLLGYGEIELELVENLLLMLAFSDEGAVKLRTRSQSLGFCGVEEGAHLFFRWKAVPGV